MSAESQIPDTDSHELIEASVRITNLSLYNYLQ